MELTPYQERLKESFEPISIELMSIGQLNNALINVSDQMKKEKSNENWFFLLNYKSALVVMIENKVLNNNNNPYYVHH